MRDHATLIDSWRDEFRQAHERDERNAARQPFDDYWSWVKTFLVTGGAGQRGWLDAGEEALGGVRDATAREQLRGRIHHIGKAIASEWAKDGRTRRIHSTFLQGSPNLATWGGEIRRAAARDVGDGAALSTALDAIEREVESIVSRA